VDWKFVSGFPTGGGFRNRVKDGVGEWNAEAESLQFDFLNGENDWSPYTYPDSCPVDSNGNPIRPYEKNGVHYLNLTGVGPAITVICVTPNGGIHDFQFIMDSVNPNWDWYSGTGNPSNGELDVWSVAAHELGHAGGWIPHFQEGPNPEADCEGAFVDRQTMCGATADYWNNGRKWMRSLGNHDKHELSQAY
jgi:hypothetical protein